jgi:hypothetical protein
MAKIKYEKSDKAKVIFEFNRSKLNSSKYLAERLGLTKYFVDKTINEYLQQKRNKSLIINKFTDNLNSNFKT